MDPIEAAPTGGGSSSPQGGGKAIASVVLGALGLVAWCLPICGGPLTLVGLILGVLDLKSNKRNLAILGIVLCAAGLLAALINAGIGAYLAATGKSPLFNFLQNAR